MGYFTLPFATGSVTSLPALSVLARAIPASLHADTEHPNTSTPESCHFTLPSSCGGLHATLRKSAFHSEADRLLFYIKALPTLSEAPAKIKLLHCYTVMVNEDFKPSYWGVTSPLDLQDWQPPRFPAQALRLNAHKPAALNFLGLFQPALLYLFRLPWGGNCSNCRATISVVQPRAAPIPLGKMDQGKVSTPPRPAEEKEWWGSHSWACPVPQKGKDGPCYSTRYQQVSAAGEERHLWSEHGLSDAQSGAGNGCFPPKAPLPEQGLAPQDSPSPAVRAPGAPGNPTTSSLRSHNKSWKYNKTQFQCKPLFNFPLCTTEPATYKVLV